MLQRVSQQIDPRIQGVQPESVRQNQTLEQKRRQSQFEQILQDKLRSQNLQFSAHAQERLQQRNINLQDEDIARLEGAVDRIAEKGGKESLIVMDNVSYVVSVPNRTVITAMDEANSNVFTNIDSAMLL